ncbi:hypothetical protein PQX77_014101 [Marasmius sp. AFHP31]|nr:hypothetical protein PQX77_014101 [Marasmius sp. AFHP31]
MAQFDLITSQAKYEDIVRNVYLPALRNLDPGVKYVLCFVSFHSNSITDPQHIRIRNAMVYGYASLLAYRAYGDKSFLEISEKLWNFGRLFTLTDADVMNGHSPKDGKTLIANTSIVQCNGGEWEFARRIMALLT